MGSKRTKGQALARDIVAAAGFRGPGARLAALLLGHVADRAAERGQRRGATTDLTQHQRLSKARPVKVSQLPETPKEEKGIMLDDGIEYIPPSKDSTNKPEKPFRFPAYKRSVNKGK